MARFDSLARSLAGTLRKQEGLIGLVITKVCGDSRFFFKEMPAKKIC
jgi:hypothetical protein